MQHSYGTIECIMKEVNCQEFVTESYIIINNLGVDIYCTCQYTTKEQNKTVVI